jgi:hypothetical protein
MNLKTAIFLATLLAPGYAFAQSSGTKSDTVHPDPNSSVGGSKSERSGGGVPLPQGSPQSGTVEMGKSQSDPSAPGASGKKSMTKGSGKSGDTTVGKDTDQPNQTPKQ